MHREVTGKGREYAIKTREPSSKAPDVVSEQSAEASVDSTTSLMMVDNGSLPDSQPTPSE
jgi:hypothetical protein